MLTYKQKFNKKYGYPNISKLTGYKKSGLETIVRKGEGAYFSNPQSVRPIVKSPEQWGMARLYASVDKSSKAYQKDKSHLQNKKLIN